MKKYKFLIFGIFIWFLAINSNALNNYIYTVDKSSKNIQVCRIHEVVGDIEGCVSSSFGIESPLSIAISKDGHYAYVSNTEERIYACKVKEDDGTLRECVLGTDKIYFESATAIAINNLGDKLYVINQVNNSIWACGIDGRRIVGCNVAGPDLEDVPNIIRSPGGKSESVRLRDAIVEADFAKASSIAISPDDKNAYISYPGQHQITICQIDIKNVRFRDCHHYKDPAFKKPYAITIDPTGRFAYIVDNDDNVTKPAISCELIESGTRLGKCINKQMLSDTHPRTITLDSRGKYAYLSFSSTSSIMKCKIINGEYGMPCKIYTPQGIYSHKHYIYAVNKNGTIHVCSILNDQGDIKDCTSISPNPTLHNPLNIAISKNQQYAYVSTGENKIYSCKIDDDTGYLETCSLSGDTSFQSPVAMVFNRLGNRLYVLNQGNNSISTCSVQDKKLNDCVSIASFGEMKASSIAISPDDRHVYFTLPETGVVDVCEIHSEGNRFTECSRLGNAYNKPRGIAIDPAGKFAYIADNDDHLSSGNTPGISCKLIESGGQLSHCKRQSLLSHRLPNSVALDLSGSYAYFSFSSTPSIMRCSINGGEFLHCHIHYESDFNNITSLSYRG